MFEFYFTMSEPSGGSGGEGAPMVYADNVKDWNNLILTKAYLDLLNEDPEDVRHVFPHLPENAVADTLSLITSSAHFNAFSLSFIYRYTRESKAFTLQ